MEERGTDSTGVATVMNNGSVKRIRKKGTPRSLTYGKPFNELMDDNPRVLIGHTRHATHGDINVKNAHPFKHGNIMGAHNGIVSNYKEIDKDLEVDSQAIFKLLDEKKNNAVETFKLLRGSMAVTWIDMNDTNKFYMVRHSNPLFTISIPELNSLFYASTSGSLELVAQSLFGMEGKEIMDIEQDKVFEIDEKFILKMTDVSFKSYNQTTVWQGQKGNYGRDELGWDGNEYETGKIWNWKTKRYEWLNEREEEKVVKKKEEKSGLFLLNQVAKYFKTDEARAVLKENCSYCRFQIGKKKDFYFNPEKVERMHTGCYVYESDELGGWERIDAKKLKQCLKLKLVRHLKKKKKKNKQKFLTNGKTIPVTHV